MKGETITMRPGHDNLYGVKPTVFIIGCIEYCNYVQFRACMKYRGLQVPLRYMNMSCSEDVACRKKESKSRSGLICRGVRCVFNPIT